MIPEWVTKANYRTWRTELRRTLYLEREGLSDFSGEPLRGGFDMHEGIVSRAVVPSSVWWHFRILDPVNCFLLLRDEHIPQPPSREWAVERATQLYGRAAVEEWFYGLPWKVIQFRI